MNVPPEVMAELHCDACRLSYGAPVPVGPAVAACDFWIEESSGALHTDFTVPFGAPLEVLQFETNPVIAGEFVATDEGEVAVLIMPYIIRVLAGPHAGAESFAYWCEVSLPEGRAS